MKELGLRLPIRILMVGREILTGRTLDTNAHWLCRRIYSLGGSVERILTLDDDLDAIEGGLRWVLDQGYGLVLTSGGLGPTRDDRTVEGVSRATGRPLEENTEAVSFVAERYRAFYESGAVDSPELTPERKKMGMLPSGAEMLPNAVGAAPAVWLDIPQGIVACLPGVPRELKTIFEEQLQDRIRTLTGSQYRTERRVLTPLGDESVLGGIAEKAMKRVPGVYMKTLPETFGPEVRLSVRIEAAGDDMEAVDERVRTAETALLEEVRTWQKESRQ